MITPVLIGLGVVVLGLLAAEWYARGRLGLGDPPLWEAHDMMAYLPKANQDVRRFGNRIVYNRHSMRCADFPERKADPDELRVMVYGDSIVNGGNRVDQADVGTEHLAELLRDKTGRPVVVGNISAGSWGAVQPWFYLQERGRFDADVTVLMLNSEDYGAVPRPGPLGRDHPTRRPAFALTELVFRYLPYLKPGSLNRTDWGHDPSAEEVEQSLEAVRRLIESEQQAGARVLVGLHPTQQELSDGYDVGLRAFRDQAQALGAAVVDMGPALTEARSAGTEPYLDRIHLNAQGHRLMADVLLSAILPMVGQAPPPGG